MDLVRLLPSRRMTKKHLHAKSAQCFAVATLGWCAVAWIDFAAARWPMHHFFGVVSVVLAVMNAALMLAQYALYRRAGASAV